MHLLFIDIFPVICDKVHWIVSGESLTGNIENGWKGLKYQKSWKFAQRALLGSYFRKYYFESLAILSLREIRKKRNYSILVH